VSLSLRKTGLLVPKLSPRRISRRWSCCNCKEQPSCYECSGNIKSQRSHRSLILEHLVGGHKQGGEICAEYWAAESVRASASYDHSTIDQSRLEIEIQDVARLVFLGEWGCARIAGLA